MRLKVEIERATMSEGENSCSRKESIAEMDVTNMDVHQVNRSEI
jgi:hypothetical protein